MRQDRGHGAIEGVHRQFLPGVELLEDDRNLIFGQREKHADRIHLGDHQHAVGIGGVYDVSWVD